MNISGAPLRRRISRSLATILFLSLVQGVVAPVIAPQYLTPEASATNPFPSGISGVIRYVADSYTAEASTWSDINGANLIQIGGTAATKVVNAAGSLGATSSVTAVQGTFATTMLFPATVTADTNYTLFYIARYAPQQSGYTTTTSCTNSNAHTVSSADKRNRIFSSESGNWLSGFWACASGVAYHEGWLTQSTNAITELSGASGNNWLLGTDCGYTVASTSTCKGRYRAFGADRTVAPSTDTVAHRIAINRGGFPNENTDFQIAEVIAVPTILQMNDVIKMETYLSRAYGIPLSAGASTKLGVYTASVGSTLGQTFTTQPQIAIQDSNSQTVTTDNTTIITATISGANGTLLGTRTATAIRGIATFDNLSVTGTAGTSYTITYTSNTSLTATSESRSFTRSSRTITVALSKATAAFGETAVATVTTSPSSNNDGTVTFTVSSSSACTVNASTGIVTVSRPFGTCSVGATIGAGATYDTATAASVTLTISTPGNETDTALELNGTNQYAWVADTGTGGVFDLGTTMTLEAWVYPTETSSAMYIVATKVDSFQLFHIDGIWKYAFRPTATNFGAGLNTLVPVRINEWHHIAITRTGNSSSFYYDGQLAYTGTGDVAGSSALNDNSIPFVIGGKTYDGVTFSFPFQGSIDQVALYSVVRDAAGIDADMDSYISPSSSGLRAYYDFNEGSGSVLFNRASLATPNSDLAILGSPLWSDVKIVSNSSAHTTVKFPRTYINTSGGWVVPSGVSQVSAFIVGGGGGGGWNSGGGGGGAGYLIQSNITVSGTVGVQVGSGGGGGRGGTATVPTYIPADGFPTIFNGTTVAGGNKGTVYSAVTGGPSITTASGVSGAGGNGGATNGTAGSAGGAGLTQTNFGDTLIYSAGGGGGGYGAQGGVGGGSASSGAGSGGGSITTTGTSGLANRGGGGGASSARVDAGFGGSGVVIVKYLVASSKPIFSGPFNDTTTAGLVETFTVTGTPNSPLVRSYQWQVSTDTGTTWATPTQGTGISSASYVTPVLTTSVSGNRYQYRVIVTDSDTAGLRMSETSSAVFLIINPALQLSGATSITKAINVAKSETYTVTGGTQTMRYTLSPTIVGITLDTSTANSPVIRVSESKTVGTFYETLTVTDSASATTFIPITITVSAPPSFSASSEQVVDGVILDLDPGSSASYVGSGTAWRDLAGRAANANLNHAFGTSAPYADGSTRTGTYSNITCGGANYNAANFGSFEFSTVGQCIYATDSIPVAVTSPLPVYTVSTWLKRNGSQSAWRSISCNPYRISNDQIIFCLFWASATTLNAGIFNGSFWYQTTAVTVPDQTWVYATVTYNGSNSLNLYLNDTATAYPNNSISVTWASSKINTGLIIGRKWDAQDTFVGSVGQVRIYDRILTSTEIAQNFNATKGRYLNTFNKRTQSKKYGVLLSDTYTVTSGADAISTTFSPNNQSAIAWDTSTARSTKLSLLETLTVSTYNETITATDSLGQSVYLPLTFTVTKADTITVIAGAATSQVYNALQATSLPSFTISGLLSTDTATIVRKYTGVDWTKPCSQGGGCEVGDTGPAGGTIFYISPTVINAATGISSGGTYLEVAPLNWSGLSVESTTAWAKLSTSVAGTLGTIGTGAENTRLINNALTTNSVAAKIAADLTFGTKSDWFLPSTLEVKEMYDALYTPGLAGNLSIRNYWTSTQGTNTAQADTYWFGDGGLISTTDKLNPFTVRPIRAYSPDTITVTTVPTNADSYTVTVDTVTMTSGLLSNYENVIFQKSGLDITKARQSPLSVLFYGATFGVPYTITVLGGTGTGVVTESLNSESAALGCALSSRVMTRSSVGDCTLTIKKTASRNYFLETATAVIYFLNWVINQPTSAAGGGATIGLNGESSVTRDPNAAPTISSLSTYTAQAGVTQIVITGTGFNSLDVANIVVKFWRNKIATGFTVNAGNTEITVTVPVGTTTGKVTVTTPNGLAVSELSLTITP